MTSCPQASARPGTSRRNALNVSDAVRGTVVRDLDSIVETIKAQGRILR